MEGPAAMCIPLIERHRLCVSARAPAATTSAQLHEDLGC
jgi:hypothetical protein